MRLVEGAADGVGQAGEAVHKMAQGVGHPMPATGILDVGAGIEGFEVESIVIQQRLQEGIGDGCEMSNCNLKDRG